ncbi:MAG: hypothetical protein AAGF31_05130 [Planctomycetota bacterium]
MLRLTPKRVVGHSADRFFEPLDRQVDDLGQLLVEHLVPIRTMLVLDFAIS